MQATAAVANCDAWGYQHNDAEAVEETAERFLARIYQLCRSERRWAVLLTHYDFISAYRTAAVKEIGPWDQNFPNYFVDVDWFHRMRLAGFETVESGLKVNHLEGGSRTINSDPVRLAANRHFFPAAAAYYKEKWGGEPGKETFSRPFNGQYEGKS